MFDVNCHSDIDLVRYYTFGNEYRTNTSAILYYIASDVFDCKSLEMMLKNDNLDINKRNSDGGSILHAILYNHNVDINKFWHNQM